MEYNGSQYKYTPVAGRLFANGMEYHLISPTPMNNYDSWLRDERAFLVAGEYTSIKIDGDWKEGYGYQRTVIVSGTWHIEYTSDQSIWIEQIDEDVHELYEEPFYYDFKSTEKDQEDAFEYLSDRLRTILGEGEQE